RFGVTIIYSKPTPKEFQEIVLGLAHRAQIAMPDEELLAEANKWELSHGGISGRTAQQFVNYVQSICE
ncbi:MAG: ATP-binding protein, partial [Lachnospiraceae bacterium]|nr:ATP-binding protein [Lachnospiraceae bacterium]